MKLNNFFCTLLIMVSLFSCQSSFEKGEEAFELERYDEALQYFQAALQFDPQNLDILYNVGRCYEELGDFKLAIEFFSKCLRQNKKFVEGFLGRARCNMKLEKYEGVVVDADNVLALDENNFDANSLKGMSCFKIYRYIDAAYCFDRAIKTKPEHLNSYYHRAVSRASFGDRNGALKDLNYFITEKDDFAQAYFNRGIILERMGKFRMARNDFNKAVEFNLKNGELYFRRGICNYQLGDKKQACKDFKTVANYDQKVSREALEEYCI
ncbi:MAG: tetratricopeptide repeat protein [Cyclobacteriaceae bacterium]